MTYVELHFHRHVDYLLSQTLKLLGLICFIAYNFYSLDSRKRFILWRIDSLLGTDLETNNETTAVAWQQPARQWTGWKTVFSAGFAPMTAHAKIDTTVRSDVSTRSAPSGYKRENF
jgi:hypothetical protein